MESLLSGNGTMGRNNTLLLCLLGCGLLLHARSEELALIPDIKIKAADVSNSTEIAANLRIYVRNESDQLVKLPTRGFSSIVSIDNGVVSVILLFQSDEKINGSRVARSLATFHVVEIGKTEMAEAEFNFAWPSAARRKYPVDVVFEVDPVTARNYKLWGGSIKAHCEVDLTTEPKK